MHPGEVRYSSSRAQTILSSRRRPEPSQPRSTRSPPPRPPARAIASRPLRRRAGHGQLAAARPYRPWLHAARRTHGDRQISQISGSYPELAARLWDVAPDGTQTLIARALYRPTGSGRVVFQLHANAWHFAAGHVVKLQLLGVTRPTRGPRTARSRSPSRGLDLRLPVHERPDSGQVHRPAPLVVPCGSRLAPGFAATTSCHGGFYLAMTAQQG